MSTNSDGPGWVYCIRKYYMVGGEKVYAPFCKLGESVWPPERLDEASSQASTWHPEFFEITFAKYVPLRKAAEAKIHAFFAEENVYPRPEKGGEEWFAVDVTRARGFFEALKGDNVVGTFDGYSRPPPVKRIVEPEVVVVVPNIPYEAWELTVRNRSLDTAERYSEFQKTHPLYPSLADIVTGCYNNEKNYNILVEPIFGAPRRQR
jgi:hypothetical protein